MSTVAPPRPDTASDPAADERPDPGRFAQWRSTWSVALRMARRDVRRHKGRSALVVVMVLLPTLLLSTVVTIAYTSDVDGAEKIPGLMGTGQAYLETPDTMAVGQLPDPGDGMTSGPDEAQPVPGYDRDASTFANADAVARLVGAPVAPTESGQLRTTLDGRRVSIDTLALDGRQDVGGKLTLTSGRWPAPPPTDTAAPVEALVTAFGTGRGLPADGEFTATVDGTDRTVRVVGTADARERWAQPGVVTAGPIVEGITGSGGWIVLGDRAVPWTEVQRLNTYGFRVTSAEVLRDPPSVTELPTDLQVESSSDAARSGLMFALAAVMLLVTTTLLVGPAFAVSATRQRRTLALAASNGAHTPVLRRTVLAQALILGALTALAGVVLGVLVAYGLVLWDRTTRYPSLQGPFDVRFGVLAAVGLCATASTLVAALVPARRLGRLDIVGVMRGQSVSPRPSVVALVAGAVLAVVGALLTLAGTGALQGPGPIGYVNGLTGGSGETLVVVGAVVLIVGSLLLVPMILAALGRLGGHLPTSLRMAARDLARHRSRSAPSVAAVLAAVAGLTFGLTGLASDTEENRRGYVPTTLPGEVVVRSYLAEPLAAGVLTSAAPGLVATPNTIFAYDPARTSMTPPQEPYRTEFVSVVPDGCTTEQTLGWLMYQEQAVERCTVAGTESLGSGEVLVLPADELVRRLDLSDADAAKVRAGAAVVNGIPGPSAHVVRGTYAVDPAATEPTDPAVETEQDVTVPTVVLPRSKDTAARMLQTTLAFAADTPTTRGWPTVESSWTVRSSDGSAVSDRAVETMQQTLGDDVGVQREDGFQRDDRIVVAILLGVFALLILVVTLTSTALTLAEQQTDQATLAALGATRGTRRVMAAAQAFLLAAVGCVLGVAVGLVPGVAIARPLTSSGYVDPMVGETAQGSVLVIPWLSLAVVGILVPLVAAGLAAAGIRRAPQVTRRAT